MIARFLTESVVLEKDTEKLKEIISNFHNTFATLRLQHLNLSDGKPIQWFLKKNGKETILCFPFTHDYNLGKGHFVGNYIGIYAVYDDGREEATEKNFIYDKEGKTDNSKKSSDLIRKLIKKLSTLPDWKSMSDEAVRAVQNMRGNRK